MSIEANIAGRKLAEEWIALAREMEATVPEEQRRPFWRHVFRASNHAAPEESTPRNDRPPQMTADEVRRFQRRSMPFGQHRGKQVGDVPLDYLIWLDESSRVFQAELHRYLATEQVQREQDDGE